MTYRDDEDAQRARIDELERKLDTATAEIAVLRGQKAGTAPGTRIERSRIGGGPSRYEREVTLDHAISERGYEAIAEVLRKRLGLHATQVGRTLTVPNAFSLTRDDAGTHLRLTGDWRSVAGAVIASSLLAGGFGSIVSAGVLADILNHGLGFHGSVPADALLTVAVVTLATTFTLGTGWWTRRRSSRATRQKLADYEGTFAAILSLAEEHAVRDVPRTRVETEQEAETPTEAAEPAHTQATARAGRS